MPLGVTWFSDVGRWLILMCGTSGLISMVSLEWAVRPVHCAIHGSLTHRPVRGREQTAVTIAKNPVSTGRTGYVGSIHGCLKTGPVIPLSKTNISLLFVGFFLNRSWPVMSCEDRLSFQSWMLIFLHHDVSKQTWSLILLSRCGCQKKKKKKKKCSTLKAKVKLSVPPCLHRMTPTHTHPHTRGYLTTSCILGCYLYGLFVQGRGAERSHRCWGKRNMCSERRAVTPAAPKHTAQQQVCQIKPILGLRLSFKSQQKGWKLITTGINAVMTVGTDDKSQLSKATTIGSWTCRVNGVRVSFAVRKTKAPRKVCDSPGKQVRKSAIHGQVTSNQQNALWACVTVTKAHSSGGRKKNK